MEKAFRVYVTDAAKIIGENTARFTGGSSMQRRWYDVVHPVPEDTRSPEEVTETLRGKLAALNIGKGGE